ncbi:MAG: hypothetical protein QOF03_246 [Alphaproteobacteria bacterium]|jgi:uncharacterized protein (DUF1501 family)|nr:hypothetical protein [Alphaproteobacteria bacterium]
MLNRRTFLNAGIACGALAFSGTHARLAFAALPDDKRFIVVILRGALDGLAAVPAHGDPDYASLRGSLALPQSGPGAPIDLDGLFGLHPSLHNLSEMWHDKELAIFHNVATPYRDRSHFDAQNVLETGGTAPHHLHDGWLNRALAPLALDTGNGALAVASSPPLLLDGSSHVTSWMPSRMQAPDDDLLARIGMLYAKDPVLGAALKQALATRATANAAMHDSASGPMPMQNGQGYGAIMPMMEGAGRILAAADGPRVGVFDIGGWDTHSNQGAGDGQLARRLQALDESFAALKTELGPAWKKTAIVAATEFGRTVAVNGTGGTDHGTGGIAFLFGGAVAGGTIHAEWSGLKPAALKDGRDLPARTDTRAIFKAALADHLKIAKQTLDEKIFPDSSGIPAVRDLIRA